MMDVKPVIVDGREWRTYCCSYDTPDGTFGFNIMAISLDHALMMIEELKQTARVDGELKAVL